MDLPLRIRHDILSETDLDESSGIDQVENKAYLTENCKECQDSFVEGRRLTGVVNNRLSVWNRDWRSIICTANGG